MSHEFMMLDFVEDEILAYKEYINDFQLNRFGAGKMVDFENVKKNTDSAFSMVKLEEVSDEKDN